LNEISYINFKIDIGLFYAVLATLTLDSIFSFFDKQKKTTKEAQKDEQRDDN